MLYSLKKLYRPEFFQGDRAVRRHLGSPPAGPAARGYFEGWYFKSVFPDAAWAFIPGISLAAQDPHCFVQVLDGTRGTARYHRFAPDQFRFGTGHFEVEIGPNRFSQEEMHLELEDLRADLAVRDAVRWPSSLLSPSSMGWYAFARFMECYHGVIVLDGEVHGTVNGRVLAGGRFYLEKDWGSSFPRAWIWMQTNSFAPEGQASLTCSIARVPFRGREFSGFIIGLLAQGQLHRFTTYTGARIEELEVGETSVRIRIRRGAQVLSLRARRETGAELASPVRGEMKGRIEETLGATVEVELTEGNTTVFAGTGGSAGLEVVHPEPLLVPGAG